jgi:hypothetical protein
VEIAQADSSEQSKATHSKTINPHKSPFSSASNFTTVPRPS